MNIYFITGNKGKFEELHSIIPSLQQKNIKLLEIQEIDPQKIIEAKLQEALKHADGWCVVEDTSLCLEGLNGLPGPLIKWFLTTIGTDGLSNISTLLHQSGAIAKTIIGFARGINDIHFFKGEINGSIVQPRGANGFGWDSIFQPNGSSKTFAEMTQEEKNDYSMRKIAALKLNKYLNTLNRF